MQVATAIFATFSSLHWSLQSTAWEEQNKEPTLPHPLAVQLFASVSMCVGAAHTGEYGHHPQLRPHSPLGGWWKPSGAPAKAQHGQEKSFSPQSWYNISNSSIPHLDFFEQNETLSSAITFQSHYYCSKGPELFPVSLLWDHTQVTTLKDHKPLLLRFPPARNANGWEMQVAFPHGSTEGSRDTRQPQPFRKEFGLKNDGSPSWRGNPTLGGTLDLHLHRSHSCQAELPAHEDCQIRTVHTH